jgi:hypothetical protein
LIDRIGNIYGEKVKDVKTGKITHDIEEPLSKYKHNKGEKIKNGILICLVISIIIGLYELYWFLGKGSGLGLVLAVLSFVISYLCFYSWRVK